jgi:hypothetical protein
MIAPCVRRFAPVADHRHGLTAAVGRREFVPEGRDESSPAIHRRGRGAVGNRVPEGRPKRSAVPSGLRAAARPQPGDESPGYSRVVPPGRISGERGASATGGLAGSRRPLPAAALDDRPVPRLDELRGRLPLFTRPNGVRQAVLSPVRDGAGPSALLDGCRWRRGKPQRTAALRRVRQSEAATHRDGAESVD